MLSTSNIIVIVFSILAFIFFIASVKIPGKDKNGYKNNKKLSVIPVLTFIFFMIALFCGLTCACGWQPSSSNFCSTNKNSSGGGSSTAPSYSPPPAPTAVPYNWWTSAPAVITSPTGLKYLDTCQNENLNATSKCNKFNKSGKKCKKAYQQDVMYVSDTGDIQELGRLCTYKSGKKKCTAENNPYCIQPTSAP